MNINITRIFLFSTIMILFAGCSKKEEFNVIASVGHPNETIAGDLSVTVGSQTETFAVSKENQLGQFLQGFELKEGETLSATLTCTQGCNSRGSMYLSFFSVEDSWRIDEISAPADTGSLTLSHTYLP